MEFLESFDQGVQHPFENVGTIAALRPLLVALYYLGHPLVLLAVLLLAVTGLQMYRERRAALVLAVAVLAGLGFSYGVKIAVDRTRPNLRWAPLPEPDSKSFPSMHALGSTALYPLLGLLISRRSGRRWPFVTGLVLAFLAGVDRLLVGHNFLSDVLAGWAGGTLLVMIAADLDKRGNAAPT